MKEKMCPICNNHAPWRLNKTNTDYWQCTNCRTVFSDALENSNMIGGGNEEARNTEQNYLRIDRINDAFRRDPNGINVLDFGCGNFMLGNDLIKAGYNCDGYDIYNPLYSKLPEKNKYDLVTAIEVFEHLSTPFHELKVINRSLKANGIVMIESSFVEIADQENIELEDFFYLNAEVGHSTLFSWHGLDLLMALNGFKPLPHWNRHVRGFMKIN